MKRDTVKTDTVKTDTVKTDTVKRDTVKRDAINSIAVITSNQARLLHPLAELFAELFAIGELPRRKRAGNARKGGKGTAANGLRQEYGRFMRRASHRGEQNCFNLYG
ncbi:MAG: hypothetical protein DYG96_05380 [Chlorobi bacterium CHB2]|nr:hypothetical protein [Chlorobi bacterium CHB2]